MRVRAKRTFCANSCASGERFAVSAASITAECRHLALAGTIEIRGEKFFILRLTHFAHLALASSMIPA